MTERWLTPMTPKQIDVALAALAERGFISRGERHPNGRYWRVVFDSVPGVYSTAWFSQSQIRAWIDGAHTVGAR